MGQHMNVNEPQGDCPTRDGGVRSRKLWYAVGTSAAICWGALLAGDSDGFRAVYETLVGGLLGAFGLYASGNVAAKHVLKPKKPDPEA